MHERRDLRVGPELEHYGRDHELCRIIHGMTTRTRNASHPSSSHNSSELWLSRILIRRIWRADPRKIFARRRPLVGSMNPPSTSQSNTKGFWISLNGRRFSVDGGSYSFNRRSRMILDCKRLTWSF